MCIVTCFPGRIITLQISKDSGGVLTENEIKYNSTWIDIDDTIIT